MKNLLIAAIVGVFLFAGSSAVSWYLMTQQEIANKVDEVPEETVDPETVILPVADEVAKQDDMPVPLRPDIPITHTAVLELGKSIRVKQMEMADRKKKLDEEKVGLQAMQSEMKLERKALDSMAERIDAKIARLTELLETIQVEQDKLEKKKLELNGNLASNDQIPTDTGTEDRVNKVMEIFATMSDQLAATMVKEYANKGDLEFVGKLIKKLEPRKATKILDALKDPNLAQQIIDFSSK